MCYVTSFCLFLFLLYLLTIKPYRNTNLKTHMSILFLPKIPASVITSPYPRELIHLRPPCRSFFPQLFCYCWCLWAAVFSEFAHLPVSFTLQVSLSMVIAEDPVPATGFWGCGAFPLKWEFCGSICFGWLIQLVQFLVFSLLIT